MVLKRQTVWLLTMLSLIIVLSVYYITAPVNDQLAFVTDEDQEQNEAVEGTDTENVTEEDGTFVSFEDITEVGSLEGVADEKVLSGYTNDEVFNSIRLERQEARDRLSEDYTAVIASNEVSGEVQSDALDRIENLRLLAQKEELLETLIKTKGYDDVLVIAEGDEVKIIVKADELSKAEAVTINQLAKEQLGNKTIAVAFQPKK